LLEVRDDGIGIDAARARRRTEANAHEGVGIPNTASRLRQLYGADYAFTLQSGPAGGAIASLALPLRDALVVHTDARLPSPNVGVLHGA
jgi:sensor histidine kinase YesM